MDYDTVPSTFRYLYAIELFEGTYSESRHLCKGSLNNSCFTIMDRPTYIYAWQFFIKNPIETSLYADDRLTCLQMSVDWNVSTWFQRIQHPLAPILRSGAEVKVHAQPLRFFRLPVKVGKKFLIEQLYVHTLVFSRFHSSGSPLS